MVYKIGYKNSKIIVCFYMLLKVRIGNSNHFAGDWLLLNINFNGG
jgi:hypothetical protein